MEPEGSNLLLVSGFSPVNILVIDSNGRRVGYDPQSKESIFEIPDALYSGPESDPETIIVADPTTGSYQIETYSTGTGSYSISVESIVSGEIVDTATWTGTAAPGETHTETIGLMENGGLTRGQRLQTDLNGDGKVNIIDIYIVAKAFGSKPGDRNWNVVADLDKNGVDFF